jgi:hypothetical protein
MTIPVKHPLGGPGTVSIRSYEPFVIEFPPAQKMILTWVLSPVGDPAAASSFLVFSAKLKSSVPMSRHK